MTKKILAAIVCALTMSTTVVKAEEIIIIRHPQPGPCFNRAFEESEDGCLVQMVAIKEEIERPGDGYTESETESEEERTIAYDPCAVSNPALAGKGCLFYLNGQIVTSNGDGTIMTEAGNIFDAEGNLVGHH